MSMYPIDNLLDKYLSRRSRTENFKMRKLSPQEFDRYLELRELWHSFNIVIAHAITAVRILRCLNDAVLEEIVRNLQRTINSLTNQRAKSYVLTITYASVTPTEKEEKEVERFIGRCHTRMKFVKEVILDSNLNLTPIAEYISLTGKNSLEDCLIDFFGSEKAVAEACKEDNGAQQFADHVLNTLKAEGLLETYQERLTDYILKSKNKKNAFAEARKQQEKAKKAKELEDGLLIFHRKFNKSLAELKSDASIGLSKQAIESVLKRNGRGGYFVFGCRIYRGKYFYKYLDQEGNQGKSFNSVYVYKSKNEAERAVSAFAETATDMMFDYAQIA